MTTTVASPVTTYAESVLNGEIVAGRLVRLACERHMRDLTRDDVWFDEARAQHAIDFFGHLRHSIGRWAGEPFELAPWQAFVVGSLFGWLTEDSERRVVRKYRTAYVEVARKNGKSTLAAGIGLYGLVADKEPGAFIFSAATKRDQAKIVFDEAARMVAASPALNARVGRNANNLHVLETSSKFEPLSADAKTLDGLNPHIALIDEIHEHPNSDVIDKLRSATDARAQPLIFEITTAGWDRLSICWRHHERSVNVLDGLVEGDTWFAYVASLDEGDDWTDEANWIKANPNLGTTVSLDGLRNQIREVMPASQGGGGLIGSENVVRRLRLNEWTELANRWLDMDAWDHGAEPIDEAALEGRACFAGLDLARRRDMSAFVMAFPPEDDEPWQVICRFWLPGDELRKREERDGAPYQQWKTEGFLRTTPGNVVDYHFITQAILEDAARFAIEEIAFDPTFGGEISNDLTDEGLPLVEHRQGFISMARPVADLERLVVAHTLQHGGNPILRWQASHAVVRQDPAGNLKIDKDKSAQKVDGLVALAMAVGRATVHEEEGPSIYESRGLVTF